MISCEITLNGRPAYREDLQDDYWRFNAGALTGICIDCKGKRSMFMYLDEYEAANS